LGLAVAYGGVRGLQAVTPRNVLPAGAVRIDGLVLAFTAAISILTGVLFGLAPAWQVSRADLHQTLKEGGRGAAGASHHRMRSILVVGEIALSLILLAGGGLMLRSFLRVLAADPGFAAEGVLTVSVSAPSTKYGDDAKVRAFIEQVVQKVEAVPGARFA